MQSLGALNKYFVKYKWLLIWGVIFTIASNYFKILAPQVTKYVLNLIEEVLGNFTHGTISATHYDPLIQGFINMLSLEDATYKTRILYSGLILLALALISGLFLFLMRQTIIVMSRHIEYDQKNEIFNHYQSLDSQFYKTHNTGDLMNRISEDVSRVRRYVGPALMYLVNLLATIGFSVTYMFRENPELTLYVLAPLPILAITIYYVNTIINRKADKIQRLLSDLTTNAQESYSGIRVIKSFVQEKAMFNFFKKNSLDYRDNAISLAKTEAAYSPSMALLVGLSTLITIMIGGFYVIDDKINIGVVGEFVMYILILTFPVSAIGWTASMIQRAATSQARINEFLDIDSKIKNKPRIRNSEIKGKITFRNVDFVYPHTGIHALKHFNLEIKEGQKVAIVGKTGSGKSTIAQLLLRFYDVVKGEVLIDDVLVKDYDLTELRSQIGYVPQDVFLFSDTVKNNIAFGKDEAVTEEVEKAAKMASVHNEILRFENGYETVVGERGVMLSGGQKQRISIARVLIHDHKIVIFDDCLSAVDAKTEKEVLGNLYEYLRDRTAIVITHRIFSLFDFDKIIVLEDGNIVEEGKHDSLMEKDGIYAMMYRRQQQEDHDENEQQ
ncbi:MAG: ABC transporter ATP-binding protein [Chitinophagaceae bacterium]|nr:ABC transporter ATP-binding protein [Chitinophagaceae bacterium]